MSRIRTRPASHAHLDRIRRAAQRSPVLDADTERRLVADYQSGSRKALEALIASHMRLVLSVADRYAQRGVPLEDLISEGTLGLMEASRRFDPAVGTRFGTYAGWWVRAFIRKHALSTRRIVTAPSTRNARRILWSLRRTQQSLAQKLGRPPSRDEIAQDLGVSWEEVAMVEGVLGGRDLPIGPASTVDDVPTYEPRDQTPSPEERAARHEGHEQARQRVHAALKRLGEREREIVQRRLLEEDPSSLAVLGETFGVSRERVRQIQERAQKKMRAALLEQVA
jgi:RNA polymerase sigma-32 factor